MPLWNRDLEKKKITGGKTKSYRKKRAFEAGGFASETRLASTRKIVNKTRGNTLKLKLLSQKYVNVTDRFKNVTNRAEILRVITNPVNIDYDRRKIITKGALVETTLGSAMITSRPGQDGVLNAILLMDEK